MVGSVKALLLIEGPDGFREETVDLPDGTVQTARGLDALEKSMGALPPHLRREADLILSLVVEYRDAGNHLLYSLYRGVGGRVPWKVFRRVLANVRGIGERGPAATASEQLAERRKLKTFEQAEARAKAAEERARRAKEKAEMATIRREDLHRGQHVFVRVRYGDQMKLRPAKINEVMRAAVNLSIEGENTPRTVRFNEIELSPDGAADKMPSATAPTLAAVPPAFAALGEGRGVQSVPQPERRHPHVEVRRPATPPTEPDRYNSLGDDSKRLVVPSSPSSATSPGDDLGQVNAWIEQGADMRESLVRKQDALRTDMDNLAAEALRIEEALTAKKAEMVRITAMLTAIDQIRGAAA